MAIRVLVFGLLMSVALSVGCASSPSSSSKAPQVVTLKPGGMSLSEQMVAE